MPFDFDPGVEVEEDIRDEENVDLGVRNSPTIEQYLE